MYELAFQILSSYWLIHREAVLSYLPVFISFLNGNAEVFTVGERQKPYILFLGTSGTKQMDFSCDKEPIPENSIAVIPVMGTITPRLCQDLIAQLSKAEADEGICSVVLLVNSPGGTITQLDILAFTIRGLSKPTVAVVSGMAASAAMWIISAASYRIATSPLDQIGSIGVMISYMDFSSMLKEKLGISIFDLYASKSTAKNEEIRNLLAGDPAALTAKADFINGVFHKAIQDNLRISAQSEVFAGAIYFAEKARELGLIDEISSLDAAINHAYKLGLTHKIQTISKTLK
jgi:protease IV